MRLNIHSNSKEIKPGDIFVASVGHTVDGHDYIEDAIKNGATTLVVEKDGYNYPGVKTIKVDNSKKYMKDYIVSTYKDYINKLNIIGVTGTNGKTTTCYLTYETLQKMGINSCYIGTIGYHDSNEHIELNNTTPGIDELYSLLLHAMEKGITHVVMEVSSIALEQQRVESLVYNSVGYTNLTQDHLDYHKTMDEYLRCKLLLLDQLDEHGALIINNDDDYAKYFKIRKCVSYGKNGSGVKILGYKDTDSGTIIDFTYLGEKYTIETRLHTEFNVYNYLMSVLLINGLGYDLNEIICHSDEIDPPKGRCEAIKNKINDSKIIIDYAHTPDAVEKIINAFNKEDRKGRVITIVGCGGDRDKTKRPVMGKIATELSDYAIITSDNPRTEEPQSIIDDILVGIDKDNYCVEVSREKAIEKGVRMLQDGDVLLILGKGHENYQIIGHEKRYFDDKEIAQDYIDEMLYDNMEEYQKNYSVTVTKTLRIKK